MNFYIKRIYDKAESHDGTRILVDKIWPRGISKQNAKLDYWWKEVAPSDTLRKWFNHDPNRWKEFKKLYKQELRSKKETIRELVTGIGMNKPLTFLYGARDTEHNHARVLEEYIKEEVL
jgi:uncharacterized protein YeaO (DUF488 family)